MLKKLLVGIATVAMLFVGCSSTPHLKKATSMPTTWQAKWFHNVETTGTRNGQPVMKPSNPSNGIFTTGNGKKAWLYLWLEGLTPGTTMTVKWDVYKPNGEKYGSIGMAYPIKAVKQSASFFMKLDDEWGYKSGVWRVKCYIEGEFMFEREFTLINPMNSAKE